jgi:hypothetical protein
MKKAERKREREIARLLAASDPTAQHKPGKKARKAAARAESLGAGEPGLFPHAIYDLVSLEREIRRFVMNVGGAPQMTLPPQPKAERKKVHELAMAFNLKSVSKGKGTERYTTLVKTTRSSFGVDERKVSRLLRGEEVYFRGSKGKQVDTRMPRHREGEVVGKVRHLIISLRSSCMANDCPANHTGSAQDWRGECGFQNACGNGMGGGRPHWCHWRAGRTFDRGHEKD